MSNLMDLQTDVMREPATYLTDHLGKEDPEAQEDMYGSVFPPGGMACPAVVADSDRSLEEILA